MGSMQNDVISHTDSSAAIAARHAALARADELRRFNHSLLIVAVAWALYVVHYGIILGHHSLGAIEAIECLSTLAVRTWVLRTGELLRVQKGSHLVGAVTFAGVMAASLLMGQSSSCRFTWPISAACGPVSSGPACACWGRWRCGPAIRCCP